MTDQVFIDSLLNALFDLNANCGLNDAGLEKLLIREEHVAPADDVLRDIVRQTDTTTGPNANTDSNTPPTLIETPSPLVEHYLGLPSLESRTFVSESECSRTLRNPITQDNRECVVPDPPPHESLPPLPMSDAIRGCQKISAPSTSLFPATETKSCTTKNARSMALSCKPQAVHAMPTGSAPSLSSESPMALATTALAPNTRITLLDQVKAICDAQLAASDRMFEEKTPAIEAERLRRCRPQRQLPKRSAARNAHHNSAHAAVDIMQRYHEPPQPQHPTATLVTAGPSTMGVIHDVTSVNHAHWQVIPYPTHIQLPPHQSIPLMRRAQIGSSDPLMIPAISGVSGTWYLPTILPDVPPAVYAVPSLDLDYGSFGTRHDQTSPNTQDPSQVRQKFNREYTSEATPVHLAVYHTPSDTAAQDFSKRRYEEVQGFKSNTRNVRSRSEQSQIR